MAKYTVLIPAIAAALTVGVMAQGPTTKALPLDNLGLEHLDIVVPDPAASAAFYARIFKSALRQQPGEIAAVLPAGVRRGGRAAPRWKRPRLVSAGTQHSSRLGGGGAGAGAGHRALRDRGRSVRSPRAGPTAPGAGRARAAVSG